MQFGDADELLSIYTTLRKLKPIWDVDLSKSQRDPNSTSSAIESDSLFPRRFLLKSLDERLEELDKLAEEIAADLFKILNVDQSLKEFREKDRQIGSNRKTLVFIDEFFHNSLYYLYDFLVALKWHENDIVDLSSTELDYVKSNLAKIDDFLEFQKQIAGRNNILTEKTAKSSLYSMKFGQGKSAIKGAIKSNLSASASSRIDSPSRRRRVRFKEPKKTIKDHPAIDKPKVTEAFENSNNVPEIRDLDDGMTVLALDLMIYSLNLFIRRLCDGYVDWQTSSIDVKDRMSLVLNTKRKLRAHQLKSISRGINHTNNVCLVILEHLTAICDSYLQDYFINVLCARDSRPLLEGYKIPRINYFISRIEIDVESKLIACLAKQNLQIFLELTIHEINLPAIELDVETKANSRDDISRGRDNYLNFITGWLRTDSPLFDHSSATESNYTKLMKESTMIASGNQMGPEFKSSSRILAQMDNLNELMVHLLNDLMDQFLEKQQSRFFLELLVAGFEIAFDTIGQELELQLNLVRSGSKNGEEKMKPDEAQLQRKMDLIAVKTRCLKFYHILHSFERLANSLSTRHGLNLNFMAKEPKFLNSPASFSEIAK